MPQPGARRITSKGGGRRPGLLAAALVIWTALAIPSAAAQRTQEPVQAVSIAIDAKPLAAFDTRDPQLRQFGALEFRGGLELTSAHKSFGGLSSIRVGPDGAGFLAVTDRGYWLRGRIVYRGDAPAGIADAELAPILGADGRPLAERGWYDTEGLEVDGDIAYVAIERVHQLVRFDIGRSGLAARGQPMPVPARMKTLPRNKGIESVVMGPKGSPHAGALIAISERGLDDDGNTLGFLIGGKTPGEFAVRRSDDYDITDAAIIPGGDLIILERHFSLLRGVRVRLRRIALADVRPGATVDGRVLMQADMGYHIDNMEGLSVNRMAGGEVVLTLVSDDNFSLLQRTLLLQFTLIEP